MTKIAIWYLPEDNLINMFGSEIQENEFSNASPKKREDFLRTIRNLNGSDILIHIFAHGGASGINRFGLERDAEEIMEEEGLTRRDTAVSYLDIDGALNNLRQTGATVIVNMMAVCNSFRANLRVDHFIAFEGLNTDQSESFEIYPLNLEILPQQIIDLNNRRNDPNEVYHYLAN